MDGVLQGQPADSRILADRGSQANARRQSIGPARQRAEGWVAIEVERAGDRSIVRRHAEAGSARLRLPRADGPGPEAVLINTAGGVAAGDRFVTEAKVGAGAMLTLTTAAAEKIYRSASDAVAEVATTAVVGPEARLEWLPQETILFDRGRLRRRLEVALDPSAACLLLEAVVFGREAHGERVESGLFVDAWRVSRGGRLVYADTLRLSGPIAHLLGQPAIAAGRRALATGLYVAPDAGARLEEARAILNGAASESGASAWDGLLAIRWLAPDIDTLRRDASGFMTAFRRRALPRVWRL